MSRWLCTWPTGYPRVEGPWTVRRRDQWGILDPERALVDPVDPAGDRRLPAIAEALRAGRLVGYRHGRRAVVATGSSFVKVVRPGRVDALVERHALLARAGEYDVPAVLEATANGRVELEVMPGRSLHEALRVDPLRSLDDVGRLLAALHAQAVPSWLPPRSGDDPRTWVATTRRSPTAHLEAISRLAGDLPPLELRCDVVVHGDLHDKNIFCDAARPDRPARLGLIDLDGLACGAPEDDVANLAVHLELRNLQAGSGLPFGIRARELYAGYRRVRPLDAARCLAVERHTWFRLACIYQYRTASSHLVPQLLRAARGRPGQRDEDLGPAESALSDVE